MQCRQLISRIKNILRKILIKLTSRTRYSTIRRHCYTARNYFGRDAFVTHADFLDSRFIDEIHSEIVSSDAWIYTTNNHKEKIKHNRKLKERRKKAAIMLNTGKFSYSKLEYPDDAPLTNKIVSYLNSPETLERVSLLAKDKLTQTNDVFISCFGKGDFLSLHADVNFGKYAFVIFLNKEWDPGHGGLLTIFLDGGKSVPIQPTYNTIVLFDIYRKSRPHLVTKVIQDKRRYAITGWYS